MIWEYGVKAIVMLTKLSRVSQGIVNNFLLIESVFIPQEKCAQYWPETLNETITPGDRISVTLLTSTPYAEYSIKKFEVKHVNIFHIH